MAEFDWDKPQNEVPEWDKPVAPAPAAPVAAKPLPSQPSFGQANYGAAYGVGRGLLGALGQASEFGGRMLGLDFPNKKEFQSLLSKAGVPEPSPEAKKQQQRGELVGEYGPSIYGVTKDLVPLVGSVSPLVKAGYKSVANLFGKSTKEAKEAASRVKTNLPEYLRQGELASIKRAAGETEAEYIKRSRQQANLRQAEERTSSQAKQEREVAARSFSDLGTPTETYDLGNEMQRRLTGTQFTREARASQQAARDYSKYFEEAAGFESSVPRQKMLQDLEAMSQSSSVGSAGRKYAQQALKDLQESKNAVGAEKEFRKYFEQASAPQQAGYGAVEQAANREVSDIISNALNTHAPSRVVARQTYKEFQTPLDAYETLFGKKGVVREKLVPDRVQMMPSEYPNRYFKNKDTVNSLREQLAGDEAAVRKFANQHTVNELQGKTASEAETWLKNNSEWVNSVEGLNTRVNRYVDVLKQAETQAKILEDQAKALGKKVKEVGIAREVGQEAIAKASAAQKEKLNKFAEQFTFEPEKATAIADNMIKYLLDNKLIPIDKLQLLKQDVDLANKLPDLIERSRRLRNSFIKYGAIGAGASYGGVELAKNILKE